MRRFLHSQKGQALVELALVVFLFTFFTLGVVQLIMLGTAHIKCHQAARRAAWIAGIFNHVKMEEHIDEINAILPGCEIDPHTPGSREAGRKVTVRYHVRAIGPFRMIKKDGFDISATSAAISYNEKPIVKKLLDQGIQAVWDAVSGD